MANKYYNEQIHGPALKVTGLKPGLQSGGAMNDGFPVKQGWAKGVPGKTQKSRSGGTPKGKIYPTSEGL